MKHIKEDEIEGDHFKEPFERTIKHLAAPWTVGSSMFWMGVSEIIRGGKSNPHSHDDAEEAFYVISGYGQIRVGDEEEAIKPGSCVFVPQGKEHQLINTGEEILKVVAVTAPPPEFDKFKSVHLVK